MKEFILDGNIINASPENKLENIDSSLIENAEQSVLSESHCNENIAEAGSVNETGQVNLVEEKSAEDKENVEIDDAETSDDIKELRSEYVKHYKNKDKTYSAVVYSEPVHYLNEDNKFSEINNELTFKKNKKRFENKRNNFTVSFNEDLKANDIFTIEKKGYKATLALGGEVLAGKTFNKSRATKIDKVANPDEKNRHNFCRKSSKLIYGNFKNNADIEYSLSSCNVKENIIIKEKSDNYEFDFDLALDKLDIKLADDKKSLELYALDSGELIFTIPAPFMFDAENIYSSNIMLNVAEKSENIFSLKIIPDANWINDKERKFPVTIDPQIISKSAQIITVKSYNSSTGAEVDAASTTKYAGLNSSVRKDIKIKVNLTEVLTRAFEKNSKILNATLELTKVSSSISSGFNVTLDGEIVDFLKPDTKNTKICIDVTKQFNDSKAAGGNLEVIISPKTQNSDVLGISSELITNENSKPVIYIQYVSEKINGTNQTYHTSDLGRAGSGSVNLFSGNLSFTHPDVSTDSSVMPIGISHVYNGFNAGKACSSEEYFNGEKPLTQNYYTGKGWKLNLHQNLIRKDKPEDGVFSYTSQVYTYIDGAGNYHDFEEKYYYKQGEEKIYVDKEKVEIGYNGKLTYAENNITYEIELDLKSSSGLNLISEITGFKNAKDLETRSEDLARVCLEVEQLENYKLDLENGIKINGLSKELLDISEDLRILQKQMQAKSNAIDDASTNLQSQTSEWQNKIRELQKEIQNLTDNYYAGPANSSETMYYNYKYSETGSFINSSYNYSNAWNRNNIRNNLNQTNYYSLDDKSSPSSDADWRISCAKDSAELNMYANVRDFNYQYAMFQKQSSKKTSINSYSVADCQCKIDDITKVAEIAILALKNEIAAIRNSQNYTKLEDGYTDKQDEIQGEQLKNEVTKIGRELKLTEKSLKQKAFERDRMLNITPVSYITGNNETYLGFNTEGRLVSIFDKYENQILIEYENDKIIKVYDGEDKVTAFNYKDGLLSSVTDARGRVTSYTYNNSFLSAVAYPDGDNMETKFEYDSEFKLTKVISPSGLGVRYNYANGKVIKAEEITETEKISAEGKILASELLTNGYVAIIYGNYNYTQITDNKENCKVYIFGQNGNVITEYEKNDYNSYIEAVKPISHDYSNGKRAFSITPYPYAKDLLNGKMEGGFSITAPEAYCGDVILPLGGNLYCAMYETAGQTLTMPENPCGENILMQRVAINRLPAGETNFILSGWAKADSAFINPHRENAYSKNEIDYKHIESFDEYKKKRKFELRAEVWYTSDGNDIEEFYCSFDWLNTGWQYCAVPVTLRKDEIPVDFKIFADYSYNVNTAMFAKIELKQGAYEESKFDIEGKKLSTTNSRGAEVVYDYDCKGKNLIKSTLKKDGKEYIVKYDYDPNNNLIRTVDFRGLVNENIYDSKGRIIKSIVYNISDPTSKFYSEKEYAENGQVKADIDPKGENENGETLKTAYEYINGTNIVSGVKSAKGHKTTFGHNPHNDSLVSISAISEDKDNINLFDYTAGIMTGSSSNGLNYGFEYDGFLRAKKILVAGNDYMENFYNENSSKFTLNNGESFETEYDKRGNIIKIYYANSKSDKQLLVENSYDEMGSLTETIDYSNKLFYNDTNGNTTVFNRSGAKGLLESAESKQHGKSLNIANTYDAEDNPKTVSYILNGESAKAYSYEYDSMTDNRLNSITLPNGLKQSNKYDGLGRITERKSGANFSSNIYYLKNGDHATNFVSSVWYGLNGVIKDNLKYSYDEHGNIEKAFENGELKCYYKYDELDRLIREDNRYLNKTFIFTYDAGGNILSKTIYDFTLKDCLENLTNTVIDYGYKTTGWKDQLISYNGNNGFVYDSLGNPTTYKGKTLTWERGRNLISYNGIMFKYNANGIRTSKTADGVITKYYLDGSKILKEERSDGANIWYHYGADGIAGFNYSGTEYIYRKNLQGDITHIFKTDGTLLVKYVYDAWGNHEGVLDTNNAEAVLIANLNPFRYRSYYYDSSIGLYYLKSRYYDSETGRFINADDISILNESKDLINGLNLYAYCLNNPANASDDGGDMPNWLKWLIGVLVIVVLAVATVVTAGIAGVGIGAAFAAGFAGSAIGVGASGLAVTIAATAFAGAVIGAGIGLVSGALIGGVSAAIGGGNFWQGALDGAANGFMWGAITGAITGGIRGGIAYKNSTPLFRAVSEAERSSIVSKGGKFSQGPNALSEKWFATTSQNAARWSATSNFSTVGVRVSTSSLQQASLFYASLDSIGPAYCFSLDVINAIVKSLWFVI